jgi:hypothetical protein
LPLLHLTGGQPRHRNSDSRDMKSRPNDRTSGTNRDFDETGESANQGHGHPREERGTSE